MIRFTCKPRRNWEKIVTKQGLTYHTVDGVPYWDESVYYSFSVEEVERIEAATNELHARCLDAVQYVIDKKLYPRLRIPEIAIPLIKRSWEEETPAIYGRFDLRVDEGEPKMLEYNADTPTSLLEAAVIQWYWLQDTAKDRDQFNSIHERLIEKWAELKQYLWPGHLYFTCIDDREDVMTASYLQETAIQAGLSTDLLLAQDIGYHSVSQCFVDTAMNSIRNLFKLYPWEWLLHEEFGSHVPELMDKMYWIEPPWKMVLSNKGIMSVLWEMFPNHKNLLETYLDTSKDMKSYVRKPIYSREGANVTVFEEGVGALLHTPGDYGEEGYVFQEYAPLPSHDGKYPVIGSWVIDGEAAGMGIRESDGLITNNTSRFVPHRID